MIEKIVLDYLTEKLPVKVLMEVPGEPPETFVLVEKTEGSKSNGLKSATFAIRSYAGTLLQAMELNELVKSAMDNLSDLESISSSKLDRDYVFNDMSTKRYRYQALYVLFYY